MVYFLFLLVSLVGYDLRLWLFLDIFYSILTLSHGFLNPAILSNPAFAKVLDPWISWLSSDSLEFIVEISSEFNGLADGGHTYIMILNGCLGRP